MAPNTKEASSRGEPLVSPASFSEREGPPRSQFDEEAPEDERTSETAPLRQSSGPKLTQVSSWACIVIVGQLLILAIALTFFMLIHFSHTPMQQNLAEWGKGSPRALVFCVTMLATLLSSLSTFLFSKSLILYLTSHSNRPAPLINFLTVSSLSRGAPLFSRHFGWTLVSLLALILVNSLTASFTTILTPTALLINVPIQGTEFNMFSPKFVELMKNARLANAYPFPNAAQVAVNNQVAAVAGPIAWTAAYASANRQLGYPGVLTYLGSSFNSTTGGVLPAVPLKEEALQADADRAPNLNFRTLKPSFQFVDQNFKPSNKFSFNYTTIQQGFTADIECRALESNSTALKPWLWARFEKNVTLPEETSTTSLWRYFVQCPSQSVPLPLSNHTKLLGDGGSMILSQTCSDTTFDGRNVSGSELLILGGFGPMYSFLTPRACQFTPYLTLSEVRYSNVANVSRIISREPISPASAPIASLVYYAVDDAMWLHEGSMRNKIGEDIASLYGITSDLESTNDALLNMILAAYFRGIIEVRATLIKTPPIIVGRGHLLVGQIQDLTPEFTRPFGGVWSYETLGWHEANGSIRSTIVGIIPILLITTTTIFLVLFSCLALRGTQHLKDEPFDPNNLVTLLQAGRDGSVVDSFGNHKTLNAVVAETDLRIQLHRNLTKWELRPVRPS
ncbi:hypothetical protein MJO28_016293 [Puccinia striiformis f. sp. tritici]|uniref:Uncharacterized protein n=1 Tax=Puccinia striiformis f. sp. tritici TaxID=168172 RepID=A0ACC0DMT4_9BASI|nr:hypothetical protein Pst134EA_030582 [Puccinia striiformis f. sp. tritici]KAH9446672.1 hypothetical protein Pst134EA_030582 [Puccinia striiformis f. sp. tritici]KAI7935422.1 hypothetical protein MJO28_016293 [Puccinia striiformis f. sp. tritici]